MDIGLVPQTDLPEQTVVDLMVRAETLGISSRLIVGPMVTKPRVVRG